MATEATEANAAPPPAATGQSDAGAAAPEVHGVSGIGKKRLGPAKLGSTQSLNLVLKPMSCNFPASHGLRPLGSALVSKLQSKLQTAPEHGSLLARAG